MYLSVPSGVLFKKPTLPGKIAASGDPPLPGLRWPTRTPKSRCDVPRCSTAPRTPNIRMRLIITELFLHMHKRRKARQPRQPPARCPSARGKLPCPLPRPHRSGRTMSPPTHGPAAHAQDRRAGSRSCWGAGFAVLRPHRV